MALLETPGRCLQLIDRLGEAAGDPGGTGHRERQQRQRAHCDLEHRAPQAAAECVLRHRDHEGPAVSRRLVEEGDARTTVERHGFEKAFLAARQLRLHRRSRRLPDPALRVRLPGDDVALPIDHCGDPFARHAL
jgi:hypothetical protein